MKIEIIINILLIIVAVFVPLFVVHKTNKFQRYEIFMTMRG